MYLIDLADHAFTLIKEHNSINAIKQKHKLFN